MSADKFEEWRQDYQFENSGELAIAWLAYLASRKAALEEAALLCATCTVAGGDSLKNIGEDFSDAIRSLIDKP